MSIDTIIGLLGVATSMVGMVVTVLLAPGLTVLMDRMMRFTHMRRQLESLLVECEESIGGWIHSTTREDWEKGRKEIFRLYYELGRIKESFPVIGGGKARRSELAGEGYLIGGLQGILLMMYLNSQGADPTEGQKQARTREAQIFARSCSELRQIVQRVESFAEFRVYLLREVWGVYRSLWPVFLGLLRRSLQKSPR